MSGSSNFRDLFEVELTTKELIASVRRHNRCIVFAQPGSEEERFLDLFKAEASVSGPKYTHILARPGVSKAAILEEFLQGTQ